MRNEPPPRTFLVIVVAACLIVLALLIATDAIADDGGTSTTKAFVLHGASGDSYLLYRDSEGCFTDYCQTYFPAAKAKWYEPKVVEVKSEADCLREYLVESARRCVGGGWNREKCLGEKAELLVDEVVDPCGIESRRETEKCRDGYHPHDLDGKRWCHLDGAAP